MGLVTVHASTPLRSRVSTRTRNPKLSSPRLFESETCPSATAGLLHASVLLVLSAACVHAVRCSVAMSEGVSKGVEIDAAMPAADAPRSQWRPWGLFHSSHAPCASERRYGGGLEAYEGVGGAGEEENSLSLG